MRLARRPLTLALALAAALAASAAPLRAQGGRPVAVIGGVRALSFGDVLPGVQSTILPTDPTRSGQFNITGQKFSEIEAWLTLPTQMTGPAGASIPLVFGPGSAGRSNTGAITDQITVDPRTRFTLTLSGNGRGFVYLGGTLLPAGQLPAGPYSATITLTVAYTGL